MNLATGRELEARIRDLESALQAIGRAVVDTTITPKRRLDRVAGIVSMFDCLPTPAVEEK